MDPFEEIVKQQQQLTDIQLAYWQEHVLFHFNWWFLLFVSIISWVLWWKLVDKKRLKEVLLYGFFVMTIVNVMDELGVSILLWAYPYKLIPIIPGLHPAHFAVLPVFYMLIYQWFGTWKSFITASLLFAGFYAFIGEPIFVWLGIYKLLNWSYLVSFPIYVLIGVLVKWIAGIVNRVQHNSKSRQWSKH